MGYRPNRQPPRCSHAPVEVRTLITDELVAHVCSKCFDTVPPPPPRFRTIVDVDGTTRPLQPDFDILECTHGRGFCERCIGSLM